MISNSYFICLSRTSPNFSNNHNMYQIHICDIDLHTSK